jgi:nucleoside-diphosphate-sugar epimerase
MHTTLVTGATGNVGSAVVGELAARVRFVPVPDAAALEGLLQAGLPGWMAENIVAVFGMLRDDPSAQVTDAVPALTGGQPRHLAEFLADHAAVFAPH